MDICRPVDSMIEIDEDALCDVDKQTPHIMAILESLCQGESTDSEIRHLLNLISAHIVPCPMTTDAFLALLNSLDSPLVALDFAAPMCSACPHSREMLMTALQDLLALDRSFLIPVVGVLSQLPLSDNHKQAVSVLCLAALDLADAGDIGALVTGILASLTAISPHQHALTENATRALCSIEDYLKNNPSNHSLVHLALGSALAPRPRPLLSALLSFLAQSQCFGSFELLITAHLTAIPLTRHKTLAVLRKAVLSDKVRASSLISGQAVVSSMCEVSRSLLPQLIRLVLQREWDLRIQGADTQELCRGLSGLVHTVYENSSDLRTEVVSQLLWHCSVVLSLNPLPSQHLQGSPQAPLCSQILHSLAHTQAHHLSKQSSLLFDFITTHWLPSSPLVPHRTSSSALAFPLSLHRLLISEIASAVAILSRSHVSLRAQLLISIQKRLFSGERESVGVGLALAEGLLLRAPSREDSLSVMSWALKLLELPWPSHTPLHTLLFLLTNTDPTPALLTDHILPSIQHIGFLRLQSSQTSAPESVLDVSQGAVRWGACVDGPLWAVVPGEGARTEMDLCDGMALMAAMETISVLVSKVPACPATGVDLPNFLSSHTWPVLLPEALRAALAILLPDGTPFTLDSLIAHPRISSLVIPSTPPLPPLAPYRPLLVQLGGYAIAIAHRKFTLFRRASEHITRQRLRGQVECAVAFSLCVSATIERASCVSKVTPKKADKRSLRPTTGEPTNLPSPLPLLPLEVCLVALPDLREPPSECTQQTVPLLIGLQARHCLPIVRTILSSAERSGQISPLDQRTHATVISNIKLLTTWFRTTRRAPLAAFVPADSTKSPDSESPYPQSIQRGCLATIAECLMCHLSLLIHFPQSQSQLSVLDVAQFVFQNSEDMHVAVLALRLMGRHPKAMDLHLATLRVVFPFAFPHLIQLLPSIGTSHPHLTRLDKPPLNLSHTPYLTIPAWDGRVRPTCLQSLTRYVLLSLVDTLDSGSLAPTLAVLLGAARDLAFTDCLNTPTDTVTPSKLLKVTNTPASLFKTLGIRSLSVVLQVLFDTASAAASDTSNAAPTPPSPSQSRSSSSHDAPPLPHLSPALMDIVSDTIGVLRQALLIYPEELAKQTHTISRLLPRVLRSYSSTTSTILSAPALHHMASTLHGLPVLVKSLKSLCDEAQQLHGVLVRGRHSSEWRHERGSGDEGESQGTAVTAPQHTHIRKALEAFSWTHLTAVTKSVQACRLVLEDASPLLASIRRSNSQTKSKRSRSPHQQSASSKRHRATGTEESERGSEGAQQDEDLVFHLTHPKDWFAEKDWDRSENESEAEEAEEDTDSEHTDRGPGISSVSVDLLARFTDPAVDCDDSSDGRESLGFGEGHTDLEDVVFDFATLQGRS